MAYGLPSFPKTTPFGNFLGSGAGVGGGVGSEASFDASAMFCSVDRSDIVRFQLVNKEDK